MCRGFKGNKLKEINYIKKLGIMFILEYIIYVQVFIVLFYVIYLFYYKGTVTHQPNGACEQKCPGDIGEHMYI